MMSTKLPISTTSDLTVFNMKFYYHGVIMRLVKELWFLKNHLWLMTFNNLVNLKGLSPRYIDDP